MCSQNGMESNLILILDTPNNLYFSEFSIEFNFDSPSFRRNITTTQFKNDRSGTIKAQEYGGLIQFAVRKEMCVCRKSHCDCD